MFLASRPNPRENERAGNYWEVPSLPSCSDDYVSAQSSSAECDHSEEGGLFKSLINNGDLMTKNYGTGQIQSTKKTSDLNEQKKKRYNRNGQKNNDGAATNRVFSDSTLDYVVEKRKMPDIVNIKKVKLFYSRFLLFWRDCTLSFNLLYNFLELILRIANF